MAQQKCWLTALKTGPGFIYLTHETRSKKRLVLGQQLIRHWYTYIHKIIVLLYKDNRVKSRVPYLQYIYVPTSIDKIINCLQQFYKSKLLTYRIPMIMIWINITLLTISYLYFKSYVKKPGIYFIWLWIFSRFLISFRRWSFIWSRGSLTYIFIDTFNTYKYNKTYITFCIV